MKRRAASKETLYLPILTEIPALILFLRKTHKSEETKMKITLV